MFLEHGEALRSKSKLHAAILIALRDLKLEDRAPEKRRGACSSRTRSILSSLSGSKRQVLMAILMSALLLSFSLLWPPAAMPAMTMEVQPTAIRNCRGART